MAVILLIPVLLLLVVFQTAVLPLFPLLDGRPDLVLLLVVGWALTGRVVEASILATIGGLLLDLASGLPLGVSAIALIAAVNLINLSHGRLWRGHQLLALGAVLLGSLVYYAILAVVVWITHPGFDLLAAVANVVLPSILLNLILAIPSVQLMAAFDRLVHPPGVTI